MGLDDLPRADPQGFGPFGVAASADTDQFVLENGLPSSPESVYLDNDTVAGNSTESNFDAAFESYLDFPLPDNFGSAEFGLAAIETSADFWNVNQGDQPEGEATQEDPFSQPNTGASSDGCDVGGLAVSVQ